jgi:outer membrane lipoprotein carrier protein
MSGAARRRIAMAWPARAPLRALLGVAAAATLAAGGGPPGTSPPGAPAGPSDANCARAAAERIQEHYEGVRDLRARFGQLTEQVTLGHAGGGALEARGEVQFAKPGRMRWSYEEPQASLVVSDGETLWIYDPEAREAQHLPLGQAFLSGAAIQFLMGSGQMLEQFAVKAAECGERSVHLVLTPHEDAPYERIELVADPETGAISETTVVDLLGNRTRVTFEDVETNVGLTPDTFHFDPPAGTRVIELPPA